MPISQKKLPAAVNKFQLQFVEIYYKNILNLGHEFILQAIQSSSILKHLKSADLNKASGIAKISGRFLKDGTDMLAIPITHICNLSIRQSPFSNSCKLAHRNKKIWLGYLVFHKKRIPKQILKISGQSPSYI